MPVFVLLGLVYLLAIAAVIIMRKLEPENTVIYAIWVALVCVVLTVFVIWYVFH